MGPRPTERDRDMPDRDILFTAVVCIDKPGPEAAVTRKDLLAVHLEYVETILEQIFVAGPLYGDDAKTIIGSLLIFRTGNEAAARALLENDPYFAADFWAEVHYNPFLGAAGTAVGGKSW